MKKNQLMDSLRLRFEEFFYNSLYENVLSGRIIFDVYKESIQNIKRPGSPDFTFDMFRITEKTAPKISKLILEVLEKIKIGRNEVDFFITSSPEVNALSYSINHEIYGGKPAVVLYAGIVRILTDEEIKFVIGHELAHIYFEHSKLNFVYRLINFEEKFEFHKFEEIPSKNVYQHWSHLSELSADRVGLYSVKDKNDAIKALIKLSNGLSEDILKIDISEYLIEIDKMIQNERGLFYTLGSHPSLPIRIKIIEEEAKSSFFKEIGTNNKVEDDSEKKILKYIEMIIKRPDSLMMELEVEFLKYAGTYLMKIDREIKFQEFAYIIGAVNFHLLYFGLEEDLLKMDIATLEKKSFELLEVFLEKFPERREALLGYLINLALVDGKFSQKEYEEIKKFGKFMKFSDPEIAYITRKQIESMFIPSII